ncbi:hypothetical protein [Actinopolymorpha alba]|uniref:hypothetical protein n=1 Tax=Actinopolymorpha alba TaxID=533267 RepID=UPI00192CDCED|nr:hypothetical protein [Actinopolymorpha alba]
MAGMPFVRKPGGNEPKISESEVNRQSWFDFARQYVAERWRDSTPKSRDSMVDGLATATRAVEIGRLATNPLKGIKRKRLAHLSSVDRRVVVNLRQAGELLVALLYAGSWKRARGGGWWLSSRLSTSPGYDRQNA